MSDIRRAQMLRAETSMFMCHRMKYVVDLGRMIIILKEKEFHWDKKVWHGAIICSLTDNYIVNTLCAVSFLCGWGFGLGTSNVRFSSWPLTERQHQTNAYACMPVRPQCHKLSDIISVTPVWNELTEGFHMQTFIIRWQTSRNRSCVTPS